MTWLTAARSVAAALPLLAVNCVQVDARPVPRAAGSVETRMDHISVVSIGSGSPVVMIPGLSSPREVWDGVASGLARNHRVILVQVNGFAGDDVGANLKPGVLDGIVADLDSYIARNGLKGAAVVGHSMGGLVGLMLAKAHPGDVGKLMIIDSLPWIGVLYDPTATVAQVEPRARAMRDQMAARHGKPDRAGAEAIARSFALKPGSQAKVAAWAMRTDMRVSGVAMYEDLTTDMRGDLAAIAAPITVLYPRSTAASAAMADALYSGAYKAARHVTMVPVDDSAHFIMLDQPEAFEKALATFLRGGGGAAS